MQMPAAPIKPASDLDPARSESPDIQEKLASLLDAPLQKVENLLQHYAESPVETIPDLACYLVGSGGKRLRPLVTLAVARAACPKAQGFIEDPVLKLAAAVEFIHSATLLHDDVIDESDTRRGRAAARNVWGAPASILVGDFLFARAFTLMVETRSLAVLEILSHASCVIAEGEVRQLAALGRADLEREEYLAIADAKTAALFEAAARSAALVTLGEGEIADALGRYGRHLGRAFQLADDALDYGGASDVIGKAIGDDFREGKITLPLLIARERANPQDRRFWDRIVQPEQQTEQDLPHALDLIRQTGAAQTVLDMARQEAEQACLALAPVPESAFHGHLQALARYCAQRDH